MRNIKNSFRRHIQVAVLLVLASVCWLAAPDRLGTLFQPSARAAATTFTVNTNDDADDSTCDVAHCSLREAINAANANAGADMINFNIPSAGVHTIALTSAPPNIDDAVTIDGYSQPGASANTLATGNDAVLLIELNGFSTEGGSGLRITNGSSTIKGLVINRFSNGCITIFSDGNVIEGNFLGTDPAGTNVPERSVGFDIAGNTGTGVAVFSSHNAIGKATPASRNLISGNELGVSIGSIGSVNNEVVNNYIGTTASGIGPLGNQIGVRIFVGQNNTIGGAFSADANLIAFSEREGIVIDDNTSADGNIIRGNSIHSNGRLGIDLEPTGVTANDAGDGDNGPNNQVNFPVINSIQIVAGNATIQASLNTQPLAMPHTIDLFSNRSCDSSGHGEGEKFHQSTFVIPDGSGNAIFSMQVAVNDLVGPYVTMTTTGPAGTSEFSQCVPVVGTPIPVNTVADTNDGVCDSSNCTLREAIASANLSPSLSKIIFNIPGAGVKTINVLSALPLITAPVIIDGYTQPGAFPNTLASGNLSNILIELNGAGAGNVDGLEIAGGSSIVRGLVINRFGASAIKLNTKSNNIVAGNFLGTDPDGTEALGNGSGVFIQNGSDNRIGGPLPADRNLISGNTDNGVGVLGATADRTIVQGNYIGVDAAGIAALGNGGSGISFQAGSNNVIGGNLTGEGNVISANGNAGLRFLGSNDNQIRGNRIGTVASGFASLGNKAAGIDMFNSNHNAIGGLAFGDANIIAANGDAGIRLSTSNNNHIEFNFIGTNPDSFAGMGNAASGVLIKSGTANRISHNTTVNNGGLGIDLNFDGVTTNDSGDGDTGANNLQNFPVLTSATRSGNVVEIVGALDSAPNTQFRVEYFVSFACDPTLNGEGQKFVGLDNDATDAAGHAGLLKSIISSSLFDQFLTATATDPSGNTSEFSRCVPILEAAPSPTPTPSPAASSLQFGEAVYSVTEDCTEVIVSVSRTGDTTQAASVDYSTTDVTATDRADFNTALGTLNFAPGETAVSFIVLINEDSFTEGTEVASLVLSNPIGATLGMQSSALLQIFDDPPEPAVNAINVAEQFVAQHYHDFLNRQHDVSGLNFWTNQIESCGTDAACIQVKRINVSAAFFLSIEFQETGFLVIRTQRAAFGRNSDAGARLTYLEFLRQAQQVGEGLIVGAPGWPQKLEANKQAYAEKIAASADFITKYPLTMTAAEYVDALFTSAGVVPTAVERQDAINAFGTGRVAALRSVVDSPSLRNAEMRGAFVLMQYFGYLRRNPTDAPDTDDSGYQFWLAKLNQFNGDFVAAEMVKAFITSTEYRQRFGQP